MLHFLDYMGKLKTLKRAGWVKRGVLNPESDSDHMHRVALIAMLIDEPKVDRDKCIRMGLVHDVCECIAGDITPVCGVSKEEKHRLEKAAMETLRGILPKLGTELMQLWEEYEEGTSREAVYVKDIDKFEMILQANEYEEAQEGLDLEEFFLSTKNYFKTELFQKLDHQLRHKREERINRSTNLKYIF